MTTRYVGTIPTSEPRAQSADGVNELTAPPDPPAPRPPDHAMELMPVTILPGHVLTITSVAQARFRAARLVAFRRRPQDPHDRRAPHRWPVSSCYVRDEWRPHELLYDGGFDFGVLEVGQTFRVTVRNDGDETFEFSGHLLGRRLKRKVRTAAPPWAMLGGFVSSAEYGQLGGGEVFSAERLAELVADGAAADLRTPLTAADLARAADGRDASPTIDKLDESDPDPPPPRCNYDHDPDPDDETGTVTYCEHAPPRALVEATPVTLDGDALGAVPRVDALRVRSTLKWTARLQVAWARHDAYRLAVIDPTTGQPYPGQPATLDNDPLRLAPAAPDLFGGVAPTVRQGHGWRCRLCGGWMRRAAVPTGTEKKVAAARAKLGLR